MFEGTLVESRGLVQTGTERWTALGSLTFQLAVAGLLLAIPLVRPEVLPVISIAPQVELPVPVKPVVVQQVRTAASGNASAVSAPAAAAAAPPMAATQQLLFPHGGGAVGAGDPVPTVPFGPGAMGGWSLAALSTVSGPGSAVAVVHERQGMAKVSGGVTEGLLLAPIRPVYPAIAKAVGVQGAVVMDAVISKAGRIESVQVTSGPPMLREAAKAAVEGARYRPYLLSGEPTEVQTTITVVFTLRS